jgi:hypothetical protein
MEVMISKMPVMPPAKEWQALMMAETVPIKKVENE